MRKPCSCARVRHSRRLSLVTVRVTPFHRQSVTRRSICSRPKTAQISRALPSRRQRRLRSTRSTTSLLKQAQRSRALSLLVRRAPSISTWCCRRSPPTPSFRKTGCITLLWRRNNSRGLDVWCAVPQWRSRESVSSRRRSFLSRLGIAVAILVWRRSRTTYHSRRCCNRRRSQTVRSWRRRWPLQSVPKLMIGAANRRRHASQAPRLNSGLRHRARRWRSRSTNVSQRPQGTVRSHHARTALLFRVLHCLRPFESSPRCRLPSTRCGRVSSSRRRVQMPCACQPPTGRQLSPRRPSHRQETSPRRAR